MNNGQIVTTYKNGRESRTSQIIFGKYGQDSFVWDREMVVEVESWGGDMCEWLKTFFTEFGIKGVDTSNMEVDDNKTFYEVICWGENKNVHFWFEVEELS